MLQIKPMTIKDEAQVMEMVRDFTTATPWIT